MNICSFVYRCKVTTNICIEQIYILNDYIGFMYVYGSIADYFIYPLQT